MRKLKELVQIVPASSVSHEVRDIEGDLYIPSERACPEFPDAVLAKYKDTYTLLEDYEGMGDGAVTSGVEDFLRRYRLLPDEQACRMQTTIDGKPVTIKVDVKPGTERQHAMITWPFMFTFVGEKFETQREGLEFVRRKAKEGFRSEDIEMWLVDPSRFFLTRPLP
jgi:hypothetical protein